MNNPKVWAILGAADGLGNAAIKYLVKNRQIVIALLEQDIPANTFFNNAPPNLYLIRFESSHKIDAGNALTDIVSKYGGIDFVINNSNYKLFNNSLTKTSWQIQNDITMGIFETIKLVKAIIPYLRKAPQASIINIPPQLCLAMVSDKNNAAILSLAMDSFLGEIYSELQSLNYKLTFLQPGERFANFTI